MPIQFGFKALPRAISNSSLKFLSLFRASTPMLRWTCGLETALTAANVTGKRRFETLLHGGISHEVDCHDVPLLTRADWVVAPTLGAIVPNWLLIVPRDTVLNFQAWRKTRGQSADIVLHDLRQNLGLHEDEIIWFEHGPRTAGTSTGCGIDHAHLHVLVRPGFSFDAFAEKARSLSGLEWTTGASRDAHRELLVDQSYLIAGTGRATIFAQNVEATGSQFFRRVVAALAGANERWDYRSFPQAENTAETIRTFRSLESATQRVK
jgi:ATP adenylyltransferase